MPLHFIVEDLVSSDEPSITLTGAEAHHAATVRRVRAGEQVTVGDGLGLWLTGTVSGVTPREVSVRVLARERVAAPSPRIVLVQALAKGDRDELAVQAATELGVDEIVPWQAARSVSRWDAAKAGKGVARWAAIAREAAKQAHRAWMPGVVEPVSTAALGARCAEARVYVLEPTAATPLSSVDLNGADARDVLLVVGPEGGIAPAELAALEAAGATLVRLGESVLRTSTAGPAAIAVTSVALGRW